MLLWGKQKQISKGGDRLSKLLSREIEWRTEKETEAGTEQWSLLTCQGHAGSDRIKVTFPGPMNSTEKNPGAHDDLRQRQSQRRAVCQTIRQMQSRKEKHTHRRATTSGAAPRGPLPTPCSAAACANCRQSRKRSGATTVQHHSAQHSTAWPCTAQYGTAQ